jgi:hypothetical protein
VGTPFFSLHAEAIAAWSQLLTLLVALVAAGLGFRQIRESRIISREAEAQESFRDYLKLLNENKDLKLRPENDDLPVDKDRYHYLVVFMLATFEKIYELSNADKNWLTTMKSHICAHKVYLDFLKSRPRFYKSFDDNFAEFIRSTLGEKHE